MNARQEAFAREYSVDHNGAQAAIRAGYSEHTAVVQASRLLTNAEVTKRIAELDAIHADKVEVTAEMVIAGLLSIAQHGERETNRVRAWELLGKTRGIFTDKVEVTTITKDFMEREIERLESALAQDG